MDAVVQLETYGTERVCQRVEVIQKDPRTHTIDSSDAARAATPATMIVALVSLEPVPPP